MSRSNSWCLSDRFSHSDWVSWDSHSSHSNFSGGDSDDSNSSQSLRPEDPRLRATKGPSSSTTGSSSSTRAPSSPSALSNATWDKNAPLSGFLQGEGQERSASSPEPGPSKGRQLGDIAGDISATAAGIETVSKGEPFYSAGSELHGTGECAPCMWFFKPRGCQLGVLCGFCHLCPDGELKQRRKKKDTKLRQIRLEAAQMNASEPEGVCASEKSPSQSVEDVGVEEGQSPAELGSHCWREVILFQGLHEVLYPKFGLPLIKLPFRDVTDHTHLETEEDNSLACGGH